VSIVCLNRRLIQFTHRTKNAPERRNRADFKWTISRRRRVILDVIRFKKQRPIRGRYLLPNVWLVECRRGGKAMTIEQVLTDISALPPSDQLRIVQAIWDRLPEGVGTDLSAAQQAELDRRWADYKADPSTALTEDEFRARIRIARGR